MNTKPPPTEKTGPTHQLLSGSLQDAHDWQQAQRRIVFYLQSLGLPSLEGFEIAFDAFNRAARASEHGAGNEPVSLTMQELHRLLTEKGWMGKEGCSYGEHFWRHFLSHVRNTPENHFRSLRSMPPVNRGCMVPQDIR